MSDLFAPYFKAIKELDVSEATEHTLRGPLENLLKSLAARVDSNIAIIHEPKRDANRLGAPDFKFKVHEAILGYLENKKIDESLDSVLQSEQIAKYKQLSNNIVVTNYLEWVWLKDGHIAKRETLCYLSDVGSRRARLDPEKAEKVVGLIVSFLSALPQKLSDAKKLAESLAMRCHDLHDFLREELERQEREPPPGRLYGLYEFFTEAVFHELSLDEFANAFAQMLGYGLFLAKLNAEEEVVTLQNAKNHIPANFALIRELVGLLDELEQPEYQGIKWLLEEILGIMNALDLAAIHTDLAFAKRPLRGTEEERLLFDKDPYVYFYEDFLKAYDKKTRKGRGVYYTPPPVVSFIVQAVEDILKGTFGIRQGLADHKRVTVLDFATGTGTFLLEVLQRIFEGTSKGLHQRIVKEHVLKNLHGFEYLIAPYTIAHLKLSQFLQDNDYAMQADERLNIYLTNTLEPIEPQTNWLLPALTLEVSAAQEIKDQPILVITGNPPYAGHSKNTGTWITKEIDAYKKVDGKPLGEKNTKWLQDDYVKFIRFAQWKMEQAEEGIVAIITNHSFLDNPTFRGMRHSLLQTFNQMYLLDLHGNTRKKEKTPKGGKDENVFDIEQGVAVSLMIKKKGLRRAVYHADLWGRRHEKYKTLLETKKNDVEWTKLKPSTPSYLFIPQDEKLREEYEQGWQLTDIFMKSNSGIVSKRDKIAFHFLREDLYKVLDDFNVLEESRIKEKYNFKDSRDGKVNFVKKHIQDYGIKDKYIRLCLYRPFDFRWTYHTDLSKGFLGWPVYDIMRHMLSGENIGLVTTRLTKDDWTVFATKHIIAHKSSSRYDISYLFPLYLYLSQEQEKNKGKLFENVDPLEGKERIENFSQKFREFVDKKYECHYSPEVLLGYIYAVMHSPTYRVKYRDFLRLDFPRIPFVDKRETFATLSTLGWELLQAHLLKSIPQALDVDVTGSDFVVEKPCYEAVHERLYINKTQYFAPVPKDVWEFHIDGYPVLGTFLKYRKGRMLSLDEIEAIQNIINALRFTIDQMQRIDECWPP